MPCLTLEGCPLETSTFQICAKVTSRYFHFKEMTHAMLAKANLLVEISKRCHVKKANKNRAFLKMSVYFLLYTNCNLSSVLHLFNEFSCFSQIWFRYRKLLRSQGWSKYNCLCFFSNYRL